MNEALNLFRRLGVTKYESRHLEYINTYIKSSRDAEDLLNKLGTWSEEDLVITKEWMKDLDNKSDKNIVAPKLKLF